MTEQGKIPLPAAEESGSSLFERAGRAFGFEALRSAPVPASVAAARQAVPSADRPDTAPAPPSPSTGATGPVVFPGPRQAVDRSRLRAGGLIVPDGEVTTLVEEFRLIKRQVLLAVREAQTAGSGPAAQRVLVCSPLPGEGKTFCATNLALSIAVEKDVEVVLVDADFAKPSIPALLGLAAGKGLMDAFADPQLRVEDCVVPTDIPNFFVLPAGHSTASDSEYLAAGHTAQVLDRLTSGAPNRLLIFDSPPALAASAAAELAGHVGQALAVCRADRTGQRALEDALTLLSACPDIKLLLNATDFSPSGRRFGAYHGHEG